MAHLPFYFKSNDNSGGKKHRCNSRFTSPLLCSVFVCEKLSKQTLIHILSCHKCLLARTIAEDGELYQVIYPSDTF